MCDGLCGGCWCDPSCEHYSPEDGVCVFSDPEEQRQRDIEEETIVDILNQMVLAVHIA